IAPPSNLGLATPEMMMVTQNPVIDNNTVQYHIASPSHVKITVYDLLGRPVKVLVDKRQDAGTFTVQWNTTGLSKGTYLITAMKDGEIARTIQVVK
ncbi:MAG: T9SS type A sorting domain-containing protein, partial [Flavisolibacter sp.]|nr:T9SS type A sorting domain-containing protein [Flavisolibacter sp.]